MAKSEVVAVENLDQLVMSVRGRRVMLDSDLAALYGVETKVLVQSVKRNATRFPEDFMFQLSADEHDSLRSQSVTSKQRGGRRYLPYVFTEQGVAMLSSVLRSERAVLVNIEIMRTFVRLREAVTLHADIQRRLDDLEGRYDSQFHLVFEAINRLVAPPAPKPRRKVGFISTPGTF